MKKEALLHRAKSEYAYAFNEKTIHITFRTARNDIKEIKIIYGDPFAWSNSKWIHFEEKMIKTYQTNLFDYYFIEVEPKDLRVKYAFLITDNNNQKHFFGTKQLISNYSDIDKFNLQNYFNYPYLNVEDLHHTPNWVKETVWYQIFPDRFYTKNPKLPWGSLPVNNHQIFGGDLKGITAKLPYLNDLGITGIYFTPIFEAKTAHKYDTINYFKIDPSFGTNEDFKELVETAHKLNIKVMLDGVFNHSGYLHPFFQDVVEKGEKSIYKNSFHIDKFPVVNFPLNENGEPSLGKSHSSFELNFKTFAYTPHMPKWNTNDPLTQKHLLEVITYWITEYNIDGWRLDVSNEISHDFLREIKKASRKANPNTFILGENWDQSLPWLLGDQLDSVMNYDLTVPIWNFIDQKIDVAEFISQINHYLATTPKNVMPNMFNLIDSHDTTRVLRRVDDNVERVKLAYLSMFLSCGAPNIYYGGEVLLTGNHDPDNRRTMIWNPNDEALAFKEFIKTLIKLRKKHKSFNEPNYNFISKEVLSFTKTYENETILVVLNNSKESIELPLNNDLNANYLNLFTNESNFYDKIALEPYKFVLLLKE